MVFPQIACRADLEACIEEYGFVPFFKNSIPGFSIEECIEPRPWFAENDDGPWEWKGPVIGHTGCAYGKLLRGKMMYVSREWYPHLANVRRGGDDFDVRYDCGLASRDEKRIMDVLGGVKSMQSKMLRAQVRCEKNSAFDAAITRLQRTGDVTIAGFDYAVDKHGMPYGWGIARYAVPENWLGEAFSGQVYQCPPEESRERIRRHLTALLGEAAGKQIERLIG